MPDLSDKILKYTSGKYFFVPFTTLLASDLHFMLSKPTLHLTTFVTGGGTFKAVDIIIQYPAAWHILKIGYIGASIIGITIALDFVFGILYYFQK